MYEQNLPLDAIQFNTQPLIETLSCLIGFQTVFFYFYRQKLLYGFKVSYKEQKIKVPTFNEKEGFYTTKKRSKVMSKIRSQNTKPEILFRKRLWEKGIRYRISNKNIIGKPDITIKKYKVAIFIDGIFWHGYKWEDRKPKLKSNREYWIPKIERNIQRDKEVNKKLSDEGWQVIRFWEHEVKDNIETCTEKVINLITSLKTS